MKRFSSVPCLAVLLAATVSACSDGTAPIPRASMSPDASDVRASHGVVAGNFTRFDFPGATATLPFAINNEGTAVGRYVLAGRTHGFVRSPNGDLTTIDFPGAGFTVAGAINNRGDIVGWYTLPTSASVRHGYLLKDGVFTAFDPPGSIFTNTLGINDRGDIIGRFCNRTPCREPGNGDFHGFLLRDGEFTVVDVPGSIETNAWKLNDQGEMVGGFGIAGVGVRVFVLANGDYTTISPPAGKYFSEDNGGINARGDVAGKYCDVSPCVSGPNGHGFAFIDGRFTSVDVPGAAGTAIFAINARRQIVGGYFDSASVLHGYIARLENSH